MLLSILLKILFKLTEIAIQVQNIKAWCVWTQKIHGGQQHSTVYNVMYHHICWNQSNLLMLDF